MPITFTDDHGNEVDLDKADGGTLRKNLERVLERNRLLEEQASTSTARSVIESMDGSLVTVEDLKGVPADQIEAKAKELQGQRQAQRLETVRSVFAARGLDGEDLEAAVEEFLGESGTGVSQEQDHISVENLGGSRPSRTPAVPPMDDAFGNLEAHFTENDKRTRK